MGISEAALYASASHPSLKLGLPVCVSMYMHMCVVMCLLCPHVCFAALVVIVSCCCRRLYLFTGRCQRPATGPCCCMARGHSRSATLLWLTSRQERPRSVVVVVLCVCVGGGGVYIHTVHTCTHVQD